MAAQQGTYFSRGVKLLDLFEATSPATMQCWLQLRTVFLGVELRIILVLIYTLSFPRNEICRGKYLILSAPVNRDEFMASRITRLLFAFRASIGYMIQKRNQDKIVAGWWTVSRSGHYTVVHRIGYHTGHMPLLRFSTVAWILSWVKSPLSSLRPKRFVLISSWRGAI